MKRIYFHKYRRIADCNCVTVNNMIMTASDKDFVKSDEWMCVKGRATRDWWVWSTVSCTFIVLQGHDVTRGDPKITRNFFF